VSDRLNDGEVRTLAALERRGRATCTRLCLDLGWSYGETLDALEALAGRGLVADEPLEPHEVDPNERGDHGRPDPYAFRALERSS
jgi:hypothetical protein